MKKNEIAKAANTRIQDALASGWYLPLTELTGSYGLEGTQTVLAKGNMRMVVFMERGHTEDYELETVTLKIARFEVDDEYLRGYGKLHWPDGWNQHIVYQKTAYAIDYRDDWFTWSKDEALVAFNLHRERSRNRRQENAVELELTETLLGIVRKIDGFKTIDSRNIQVERMTARNGKRWYKITNTNSLNAVELSA